MPPSAHGPQARCGREESHTTTADGIAVEMINFAARTRGHIAYAGIVGRGAPIAVHSDTLFFARTWKNEFR